MGTSMTKPVPLCFVKLYIHTGFQLGGGELVCEMGVIWLLSLKGRVAVVHVLLQLAHINSHAISFTMDSLNVALCYFFNISK